MPPRPSPSLNREAETAELPDGVVRLAEPLAVIWIHINRLHRPLEAAVVRVRERSRPTHEDAPAEEAPVR